MMQFIGTAEVLAFDAAAGLTLPAVNLEVSIPEIASKFLIHLAIVSRETGL